MYTFTTQLMRFLAADYNEWVTNYKIETSSDGTTYTLLVISRVIFRLGLKPSPHPWLTSHVCIRLCRLTFSTTGHISRKFRQEYKSDNTCAICFCAIHPGETHIMEWLDRAAHGRFDLGSESHHKLDWHGNHNKYRSDRQRYRQCSGCAVCGGPF